MGPAFFFHWSKAYYCKKAWNNRISGIYLSTVYDNIAATDKCQDQKSTPMIYADLS